MTMLQDNSGNTSSGRVMAFIIIIAGLVIGAVPAIMGNISAETVTLSLGLVTIGFTGKVVSKGLER